MIIYPNNLNTQEGPFTYNLFITKYQAQFIKLFGPNWQMLMAGLFLLRERDLIYPWKKKLQLYNSKHNITF